MSAATSTALSPQEALARDLIVQRSAARHHAPRRVGRHVRAALLLRRLAERLDPGPQREGAAGRAASHTASDGASHAERVGPRPWAAESRHARPSRRAPHRHS